MMKFSPLLCAGLLATFAAQAVGALDESAWSHRQEFEVPESGLFQLELPPAALAVAALDWRDVRLIDATGRELPWRAWSGEAEPARWLAAENFTVTLAAGETIVRFRTSETAPIAALELQGPEGNFVKAVDVETSSDGQTWELVSQGAPWFSQNGAQENRLRFTPRAASEWRVRIDDRQGERRALTGVRLERAAQGGLPSRRVPVRIASREEFAGQSVLQLELPHAHAPVAALWLETNERVLQRTVRVLTRQVQDEQMVEREIGRGVIRRLAVSAPAAAARLGVPVTGPVSEATVQLVLENGDNAPLPLSAIEAELRPARLVFAASAAGRVTLLVGASGQTLPRYDLPAGPAVWAAARLLENAVGPLVANPSFRAPESLPGVPLEGAPLDLAAWKIRRVVRVAQPGFQQLELDLSALAQVRAGLADLRLVRENGRQVPFLLAASALERAHPLVPTTIPDERRPGLSRWQLALPQAHLPVTRLTLRSSGALFERPVRLVQRMRDARGEPRDETLAEAVWRQQPGGSATARLDLPLRGRALAAIVFVEIENGDNQPIVLTGAEFATPVVRLFFKTGDSAPLTLAYANPAAAAPRYDLRLVAPQVLAAPKSAATLEASASGTVPSEAPADGSAGPGRYLFWAALALVVVLLLVVVAKLAPKPADGEGG